ncbi:Grx4 family monothiol glutaredoxin [Candidatus Bandiella numerosa]|jgi:monothiol glutaredoxin|uniref:Grx4 family monothiol glutaredoxin n=1 Tax=Candidatus Bandiella numerosa TaxID=2570586 RepID=UPI00249DD8CF|nr:Grx4 family monothiol glutaredoxin [Candidatus Bandiella numerosa]WHA05189.1 Grx4 family monothiol glutaredoxin [Candidatus Bandiella numerosa]
MNQDIHNQIKKIIEENRTVLFMKGTPEIPMCGFSATVVNILNILEVEFLGINILDNDEMRQGIKEYSDWPTIPQLYVNQEFVGGCDIVQDMYKNGELQNLLFDKKNN